MNQDQKFEQIWEFRRRDDDFDSSSDDSKSNLVGEPTLKRHKLVPNLLLPENGNITDSPRSQNTGQLDHGTPVNVELKEANTIRNGLKMEKRSMKDKSKASSVNEGHKKKSKRISEVPVLDELTIFMKSILEDLRVARESMFARMTQDLDKLVKLKSGSRPARKKCVRARKTSQKQRKKRAETQNCSGDKQNDVNNGCKVPEERIKHDQVVEMSAFKHDKVVETNALIEKEKGDHTDKSSVRNRVFSEHPDQAVASSYLTLPSMLSDPQISVPQVPDPRNDTSLNYGKGNLMIDGSSHYNYFSGIGAEEVVFRRFPQIGTKSMGNAFPAAIHQRLENGFGIPSQVVVSENPSRDCNMIGLRMTGGATSYSTLSDHFPSDNFRSFYRN